MPRKCGPYLIGEAIGVGGMGTVYRATHERSGDAVALKTVTVRDSLLLAGIRREIHALAHVRHPHVIQIVDEGVTDGVPWYAMELLEGMHLRGLLQRAHQHASDLKVLPSRIEQTLTVMRDVCEALEFLHGEGIVHRDVKPENIFLTGADQHPILMDFGLASRFRPEFGREVMEAPGGLAGTTAYLAPELIRGAAVDARTDLYALGCVLYECLTGQVPFTGDSVKDVIRKHLSATPLAPSALRPEIPAALDKLVLRLLSKQMQQRWARAADVANELTRLGAAPTARTSPRPKPYLYRSELIGREAAIGELHARLDLVSKTGRGAIGYVAGESGCGKTRIVLELSRAAARSGFHVIAGEGTPSGGPLHPLGPLLEAYAEHCRALGGEDAQSLLGWRARILQSYSGGFTDFHASNKDSIVPEGLSARAAREQAIAALIDTVGTLASLEPLLLVLDDLQWCDELTLAFLQALAERSLEHMPVFVLGTYRSEETTPAIEGLVKKLNVHTLALGPLDSYATFKMVEAMLGTSAAPVSLAELVWKKSGGNPFFIAEYLHTMLSDGFLSRDPLGHWLVAGSLYDNEATLALPESVRVVIERRLLRLTPRARSVLEAAAVLARRIDLALLGELSDLSELQVLDAIQELTTRGFLQDNKLGELAFAHDRLREVSYMTTPTSHLRSLHGRAARALEARHAGQRRFFLYYPTLAHHFERAGEIERAIGYYEQAGESIHQAGSHAEALAHLERADALYRSGRAGGVTALRRARLHRLRGDALFGLGRIEECRAACEQALHVLGVEVPQTSSKKAFSLLRNLGRQLAHLSAPRLTEARDERAKKRFAEAALAAQRVAERHYYAFEAAPMIDASLLSVNLAERAGTYPRVARTYAMLGLTVGLAGMESLSHRYFTRASQGARAASDLSGLVFARYAQAAHALGHGRWELVREATEEALACADQLGDSAERNVVQTLLGHLEFYTGALRASADRYAAIAESARLYDNAQHRAWGLYAQARALIELGEVSHACALLREARYALLKRPELASEIICYGILARAQLLDGDLVQAQQAAREAESRIQRGRPVVFSAYSGYAGAAEVWVERWQRTRDVHAQTAARRLSKALASFARTFPIARPAAERLSAECFRLEGKRDRALAYSERSLRSAEQLAMPHERQLSLAQLQCFFTRGNS